MKNIIKNPLARIAKAAVVALCVVCLFSCGKNEADISGQVFEGTEWKLVGFFNGKTGTRKLEPKSCEKCYTISFEADSIFYETSWFNGKIDVEPGWYKIFRGYSSSNIIRCSFKADYKKGSFQIYYIGGSEAGKYPDGNLFRDALYAVQSFSFRGNELKLYISKKKYLIFNQIQP